MSLMICYIIASANILAIKLLQYEMICVIIFIDDCEDSGVVYSLVLFQCSSLQCFMCVGQVISENKVLTC